MLCYDTEMPMLLLSLLLACTGGSPEPTTTAGDDDDSPVPTGPKPTTPGTPTADTGPSTTDTGFVVVGGTAVTGSTGDTGSTTVTTPGDCDAALLATAPLAVAEINGVPTSEEFEFDAFGNLVNVSDTMEAIMSTDSSGVTTLIAPYDSAEVAGTRFLPDGTLVFADEAGGSIVAVDMSDGSRSVLASGLVSPNSIATNSAGEVFSAGYGEVVRIRTDGSVERILEISFTDFDGAAFSPDESSLYLNHDDGGTVGRIDFDSKGDVIGFSGIIDLVSGGWGTSLDGAAVDACGRYYVVDVGGTIFRVDPDTATVIEYADLDGAGAGFTTSLRFGSGVGGWERDHLYVMDRDGAIWDLTLDVEGAQLPHL
jgi:sugar lactone lactonase YvrE